MKATSKVFLVLALVVTSGKSWAQGVGINTDGSAPDASALLDVKSTDKGILVPRLPLVNVNNPNPVSSPATGLLVYNTNASVVGGSGTGFYYWNGSQWVRLDISNGDWRLVGNAGTNPANNFLGTTDNVDLVIRTNNNERIRVAAGGNVGIGTNSPQRVLHIERAGDATIRLRDPNDPAGDFWELQSDAFNPNSFGIVRYVGSVAQASSSVVVTSAGNVGFGTAAPDRPLTVVNNSEWNIVSRSANATPTHRNHLLFQRSNGGGAVPAGFTLGGIAMGGYDGSNFSFGWNGGAEITAITSQAWTATNRGTHLIFNTTADNSASVSERMRITSNGEIGIGTAAPTERLHVNGNLRLDGAFMPGNSAGATGALLRSNGAGTAPSWLAPGSNGDLLTIAGGAPAWTSPGSLGGNFILNQNSSDQTANFRISGTGRANTSFQAPLYTRADAGTVAIRPFSNSTTAIQLQNASGTSILNVDATNSRVGIGTTSPTRPLQVQATGLQQIAAVNPSTTDNTDPAEIVFDRQAVAATQIAAVGVGGTSRDFFIWVNGFDRVNISETGNVGIGTTTPSERLHVAGNLRLDNAFMPGNNAGASGALLRSNGAGTAPSWLAPGSNGDLL
ncbi:MAG: hypothetical protein N2110_10455, partial [Flavobacteriales bacterium]|nr:hypothetical protein [Flavobacteriales bacterium]